MSWLVALRLGRVSNLPTVWTNIAAGLALSGARAVPVPVLALLLGALSLFYLAGMYLNDAFDRNVDARERPGRPIPSGEAGALPVFVAGFSMLAAGMVLLGVASYGVGGGRGWPPLASGLVLAGGIVYYDARHKIDPLSPLVMGLCRALVYLTAALAVAPAPSPAVISAAAALMFYLVGLTYLARQESLGRIGSLWSLACLAVPFIYAARPALRGGATAIIYLFFLAWTAWAVTRILRRNGNEIPRGVASLIAGISFLDALLIAGHGAPELAFLAVGAAALTTLLQRYIPGT